MINKNQENKSFSIGILEFVRKYYSHLGLSNIIGKLKSSGIPLDSLVKGMISSKLGHNQSFCRCGKWINQPHILRQLHINKSFHEKALYRGLEILGQNEELILSKLQLNLFSKYRFEHTHSNLDWSSIVLYGNASPLSKFGYSSDHRPDKKQLTFGIGELAKPTNVPFALTIKAGNVPSKTHFKDTLLQSVKHLKEGSLIISDRGANTKDNKALVKDNKMNYLTARILSDMDNEIISKFSIAKAKKVVFKKKREKEVVYCKKLRQNEEFIFVCYSSKLYEQQISKKLKKIDEELAIIKQLSEKIRAGKKVKLKFSNSVNLPNEILKQEISLQKRLVLHTEQELRKQLEEIHINSREGFYFLESSINLTGKQAIQIYKNKDSIEKTINSLKNEIEIKPARVWTESSIKGALIIGFLAQLFVSLARFEHQELKSFSTTTIVNSLKNLTLTIKKSGNELIEQIISNIEPISMIILPNLVVEAG